jgi:hypothetical protein
MAKLPNMAKTELAAYRVQVDYQSETSANSVQYLVSADGYNDAIDRANARLRADKRRNVMKIDGGNAEELNQVIIWRTPYKPPQDAVGYFTLAEASRKLKVAPSHLMNMLDCRGHINRGAFRAEWDE